MRPTPQALSSPPPDGCFHCGLPVLPGTAFRAVVDGAERTMCCAGCVAASELIAASGLAAYYRYRERPGGTPASLTPAGRAELTRWDHPALQRTYASSEAGSLRRATFAIEGMRCGACAWLIEQRLARVAGVREIAVDLASARADVVWDGAVTRPSELLAEIASLGYPSRPYRPDLEEEARRAEYRAALWRLAVAGLGAMQVMMYAVGLYAGAMQGMEERYRDFLRWVSAVVTAPVLVIAGGPFFTAAWRDLRNRRVGIDVPVALALGLTFAASLGAAVLRTGDVYFESVCMFIFLLSLGRFVEMRTRHRAAAAIEHALRRPPACATRLRADGEHEVVSVWELVPGDVVLVKPGETAPADGTVVAGRGWVDESMLTGEHWPRRKDAGDPVAGGTQNGESPLTLRVERVGGDTVLAGILRLVDRASRERPRLARVADRVAARLLPGLVGLAVLSGAVWAWIDPARTVWVMVAVLVVSCPCALSLATPAALAAAGAALVRRGVLPTRGHVLETLGRATHVLFDKTGTLTEARLRLVRALPVGEAGVDDSLAVARAMERGSEHPIAAAFDAGPIPAHAARPAVEALTAVAGRGIEAIVHGRPHRLGLPEWAATVCDGSLPLEPPGEDGTWILLAAADGPRCWFELEEVVRRDAIAAVGALRALGLDVQVVSGDTAAAVGRLAHRLDVTVARSRATPEAKLAHARNLQQAGGVVVMVGDGVNDAPGLGGADVAIAMGGGSDLARSRADAMLLQDDLGVLPEAIRLARRTRRVIGENLAWAIGYNAIAIPLAAAGLVPPWWAAIGMSLSSLLVVVNAGKLR
jgi:Cu2+-exporting ATPase